MKKQIRKCYKFSHKIGDLVQHRDYDVVGIVIKFKDHPHSYVVKYLFSPNSHLSNKCFRFYYDGSNKKII